MFKNRSKTPFENKVALLLALSIIGLCGTVAETRAQPDRSPKSFSEIAKMVEPAVVSIDTKGKTPQVAAREDLPPGDGSDIMDFLRRQTQAQRRPVRAVGSGFLVDKSGYIVTNAHVVESAIRITVTLDSGEEFYAKVVGSDDQTDIAILKIDAGRDLPFVKFGDSDKSEVGDWVLAIGSPFGLTKTVTAGIISQKQRETPYSTSFQRFIQTDASINRGNSGGPLVNLEGEVIGVNSQIATSTGDSNGIGFALPSRVTEDVYGQIVKNGKVRRGYLGANLDSVKSEYASVYGLKDARGAIITAIRDKRSSAAIAGLRVGDVVVEFNNRPVESAIDLIAKVAGTEPDQTVSIKFLRENGTSIETRSVSIKLSERPPRRPDEEADERRVLPLDGKTAVPTPFGLTLDEVTPVLTKKYGLVDEKGLVVREINPASFISDVKDSFGTEALIEGDLIQKINRTAVTDLAAFNEIVKKLKAGDAVVLHVIGYLPRSSVRELKIVQFTVR